MILFKMMRASQISLGNSDKKLWILAFPMSLMILVVILSRSYFIDTQISSQIQAIEISPKFPLKDGTHFPPILAYWICGTNGDSTKMLRLLKAIYHPRNQYLLQLDAEASIYERGKLFVSIKSEKLFQVFGNVNIVGRVYGINKMGASALSAILHAAALLLKLNKDWDWFINLSPFDYPLMSQDDLLHAMTSVPRDLNFIHFSNEWKEKRKVNQVVLDPSLYLQKSSDLFYAVETRPPPDAFKIFGGSPWVILTRSLMEHCIEGSKNFPRKLLMYFNNVVYPLEFYFHTVICNTPEFQNTTMDINLLRYNILENHDTNQNQSESAYDRILSSGKAFVSSLKDADSILNELDNVVLNRRADGVALGHWCLDQLSHANYSENNRSSNLCSTWGDINTVKPGAGGTKLASMVQNEVTLRSNRQCYQ